jgi:putative nucleotidyltransferase with HDIG domain
MTTPRGKDDFMQAKNADRTIAQQVELSTGRLDSLSTLPCVAAKFFPRLMEGQLSRPALADIIESEPSLAARILSIISRQNTALSDERFSLRHIFDRLSAEEIVRAFLSVKVLPIFEAGHPSTQRISIRKELLLHSLAVACCAKDIAEITLPQVDPHTAYCAGLLHDIGKLAIEEAMPKSFVRIIEEARSAKQCSCTIERQHLIADHTIFGKHLAEKWQLPNQIVLAIWLHHSNTAIISWHIPEARIAQVVQSADAIARQAGIGQSGSFDSPEPPERIAQSLGISLSQLQQIARKLPEAVKEKSVVIGLDLPDAEALYCDIIHSAASHFARKQIDLSLENRRLQTASRHLDFTTDFLLSYDPAAAVIDIAEDFAVRWQKFYQTGMVCLYFTFPGDNRFIEAVVVESLGQCKTALLNVPEDTKPIPETITKNFAVLDAHEHLDWLFEQLDVDFDRQQTMLVPLLSAGRAVGAIVFELHWPIESNLMEENFRVVTSIAGSVLDSALNRQKQEYLAECFAPLISDSAAREIPKPEAPQKTAAMESSIDTVAEMAAGIAHELNNPLSVVSGRAQLLAEAETNAKKKQSLIQIQDNAREASAIIEDLIGFANPLQPRPAQTNVKQIINEAIQLASQKANIENINAQVKVADDVENVFVDSAQIASAIANIICNSLESYTDKAGPITITADTERKELVKLRISDSGCGMDAETLRKATQPFFSAKPAGRKRGMGLAYAARFIQLNNGTLNITSRPGSGTTVTISLPRRLAGKT